MASQAEIDLIVNASNALPQITRDLDRIVRVAEDGADDIDLTAALDSQRALTSLAADLDRVVAAAGEGADDIDLDAVLDTSRTIARLQGDLDDVISRAQAGANQDPLTLRGVLDGPATLLQVRSELDDVIRTAELTADDIDIDVDIDTDNARRGLRRLIPDIDDVGRTAGRAAGSLAPFAVGIAGAGLAAGGAVPLLAGLVTSIESVLPASAVATQGMLAMQLVSGTLKIGMLGVSEAIETAFDPDAKPEDLAKAMEGLAPEARSFVKELVSMRPAWEKLQLGVQNRLFKDLDSSLSTLAAAALPSVRGALNRTANSLNDMAQGAAKAATEMADNGTLGRALKGATNGLENLERIPGQAVVAFTQLAAAAAPAFDRITKAVARVADGVSEDLARAFESGELEEAIDEAIEVIKQLGRIAGNVFGIVKNLISGVSVEGNGLFSTLEKVTQSLQDVTGTEAFQTALGELMKTMSALVDNALPLLTTGLSILGEVITILAPYARELIAVLGTQLHGILEAAREPLKALASAFGELVLALLPVLELAGELIVALLPSLTPLFEALGDVIIELAPVIKQLAENIAAQLVPLLERLPEILEIILPPFVDLATQIFPLLVQILQELEPSLLEMSEALGELAVALAPVIAKFLELLAAVSGDLITYLGPVIVGLVKGVASVLTTLADVLTGVVIPGLRGLKDLLSGDVRSALVNFGISSDNLKRIVAEAFMNMLASVGGIMDRLIQKLTISAAESGQRLLKGITSGGDAVIRYLAGLPSRIVSSLGNINGLLVAAGRALMQGFLNGIISQIGRIQSTLSGLTSMIPDWKGPAEKDAQLLTENGRLIMQSLLDGFDDRIPDIRATLGDLTNQIPGAVGTPNLGRGAPTIYVRIGNEAVDQYVTTIVDRKTDDDDRTMAQGVRR